MKKRLFSIIFFAFLSIFTNLALCNPSFHLTEAQKHWFDNLEKEWMEPFKKLAHLDDQEMKLVVDTIADMKKQRFDWLFQSEKIKCYHDENIPKDVMQKTYKILQKHGINPYRINIRTKKDNILKQGSKTINAAAAAGDHPYAIFVDTEGKKIVSYYAYYQSCDNPTLWLYEPCYNLNDDDFEVLMLHECGHLVEAHSGQRALLSKVLQEKNVPKKAIANFFERFTCVIELIADQRLTIGNEERIKKMLAYRFIFWFWRCKINYDNGYPSYFTRWTALKMMQDAFQKPSENRLTILYNKLRATLGLVPC